ncbi:MAG TPA: condensation domain-containing protein, partial [Candidatus Deferrimicrobium sp.]|nr:condensation domain-containing protein [Candidatus Deferrimicrobium sp.]
LYMNMMAVLNTLFYKYTGQTDIIIGSGIAGRRHADIQGVVGMFVNTLAMRNYPNGEKSYESFLKEVIADSVKGFENQDVQFEDLVDRLQLPRKASRNPLFDISMVVQNFTGLSEEGGAEIAPLTVENIPSVDYKNKTSKFDMTFFIKEAAGDIHIDIEYYTGIFKEETINRLISHFKNTVKTITSQPFMTLKDIDIMSREEKSQVLYEFNNTAVAYPKDETIHGFFEEQVNKIPDRIALVYDDKSLSFRELDQKANRLAHYLHLEKQMQPGKLVGILLDRSPEQIIALLAVLKAGGGYLPLDYALPEARIKNIIEDAQLAVVLSSGRFIRILNKLQWECQSFNTFLCLDSSAVYLEEEAEKSGLMDENLWDYVADSAIDEITGGGWFSSYTGEAFTNLEMAEYGDNILQKLTPLLHVKMNILEIGCGSGISMYRIAPKVGAYYATDLSGRIIENNRKKVLSEGHTHIFLSRLAAHEIDRLEQRNFDLVIINSVIQSFHGLNYLRNVIVKSFDMLGDNGCLFLGDI